MSIAQTVGKPDWYGNVENAWFPTAEACDQFDIPSFEGYMGLYMALDLYPNTNGSHWEVLSVDDVEECVIHFPEFLRNTGEDENG